MFNQTFNFPATKHFWYAKNIQPTQSIFVDRNSLQIIEDLFYISDDIDDITNSANRDKVTLISHL